MTFPSRTVRRGHRQERQRRPFSIPDEVSCYFDTPTEPANIHIEMRVPGHLDHQAFLTAAAAALTASPRASSRRAPAGPFSYGFGWERPAELDIDPVSFTAFADMAELAVRRSDFLARAPSIDVSPPCRLLVASGPGCDHVILNAHHATMDGLSWLDLLRDLARRYRLASGALAEPGPAIAGTQNPADHAEKRRGLTGRATGAGPAIPPGRGDARWPRRPARIAAERGGGRGCGLRLHLFPGVPAVPVSDRGGKATLNDALIAAAIVTVGRWNAEHGLPARQVRVTMPVNARPTGQRDAAGNHSRIVTVAAYPPGQPDLRPVLLEVARQTRRARQSTGPQVPAGSRLVAAAPLPAPVKRRLVRAALRTAGPLMCDTVMLTNLGNVPDPPDFGLAGTVTMGLSGPAQMPRGMSIAAITAGGQLQLGVRFNRALLDDAAAAKFVAGYVQALEQLAIRAEDGAASPAWLHHDWSSPAVAAAGQERAEEQIGGS